LRLKKVKQLLKTFADDSRLRIINLLNYQELTVTEICEILNMNQPNISKHLAKLRLTSIVGDRREGTNVYYYLTKPENKTYKVLLETITIGLADLETFKKDIQKINKTIPSSK